ncbi:MAG TPA: septal ring lytic transglycosylase RlpA family protein [Candidatus Binataceae bacterium]|nr:septal ring lytic transglycosylase RlpA family protein [Candidatus Binataceae bacterium]
MLVADGIAGFDRPGLCSLREKAIVCLILALTFLGVSRASLYAQEVSASEKNPTKSVHSDSSATSIRPGKTIVGKASWYGPGFNGRETASGERFNQNKSTAASKRLPLGTHAKVTNLRNGRSAEVRINDCGPDVAGRKIDLSKKVAQRLDMTHKGVAPVKIKVLDVPPGAQTCEQVKKSGS